MIGLRLFGATAAALLLATSANADTGTFHYRINNYPAVGDCHAVATEIGQKFESVTGIHPESSECTDITDKGFNFEVTYQAADLLEPVSTVDDGHITQDGVFATRALCEEKLAAEVAHFEQATGLAAVVGYCRAVEIGDERPFDLRIDSFGTAALAPFHSAAILFDRPLDVTRTGFETSIATALAARGVDVRYAVIQQGGGMMDLDVLYYAVSRFTLSAPEYALVDTRAQCLEQLTLAQNMTRQRSEAPIALYCGQSMIGSFYVISVQRDLTDGADRESAEHFASYDACMGQRAALVDSYNQRLGNRVSGGLCSLDEELVWRVRLQLQ